MMTSMPPALATAMKQDSLPKSIPITGVAAMFLEQIITISLWKTQLIAESLENFR